MRFLILLFIPFIAIAQPEGLVVEKRIKFTDNKVKRFRFYLIEQDFVAKDSTVYYFAMQRKWWWRGVSRKDIIIDGSAISNLRNVLEYLSKDLASNESKKQQHSYYFKEFHNPRNCKIGYEWTPLGWRWKLIFSLDDRGLFKVKFKEEQIKELIDVLKQVEGILKLE